MTSRSYAGLTAIALAAFVVASPALAQYRMEFSYCDRLQAQYQGAVERAGGTGMSGQRMVEIDRISRDLAQAQMAAQRYNCTGGFFIFGPRPSASCPAIMGQVNRLSSQLSQLRGNSFGLFGFSPEMEVNRLRDALTEGGCGIPNAGGYRTLCVRRCDGYYFPIEFSAGSSRFDVDAQVCQSMYSRDGEAELFVQPNSGEVADATSLDSGARYGDQPYAFQYRDTLAPACVAELQEGMAALADRYRSQIRDRRRVVAQKSPRPVPLPQPRLPASEDPETLANAAGGFTVKPVAPMAAAVAAADAPMSPVPPKSVRLVGPAYYADMFDLSKVRAEAEKRQTLTKGRFSIVSPASASEKASAEPATSAAMRKPFVPPDD